MPIIVIYWQSHGLGMRDIFILQVIFSLALVGFEVPSGYLADRFGHRTSLITGSILGTLGFFVYWAMPSFIGFAIAEVILALSSGFFSGARDALLFATLKQAERTHEYTKLQGLTFGFGNVSEAVAAIATGVIVSMSNITTVLLLQWVVMLPLIPLSIMLIEVHNGAQKKRPQLLKTVRASFSENRRLQALNLLAGGLSAATLTMVWFAQPHWEQLGLNVAYLGYIWAGLNIVVATGAFIAHRLETRLRFRTLFFGLALAPPLLYLLLMFTSGLFAAIALSSCFWLVRGISQPIISDYVQRECTDEERATTLSINALASRVIFSVFSPFLGWIADIWSFSTAFMVSSIVFGACTFVGLFLLNRAVPER